MTSTNSPAGAATGQVAAIICWLVTGSQTEGAITVDNLGADFPMLAGNVAALGVSSIVTSILSFTHGEAFDWEVMRQGIRMIESDGTDKLAQEGADSVEGLNDALTCEPPCLTPSLCANYSWFGCMPTRALIFASSLGRPEHSPAALLCRTFSE